MSEPINFVDGLTYYPPRDGAPDFVVANLSIHADRLANWLSGQAVDEKGYLRVAVKKSSGGKVYCALDTYRPKSRQDAQQRDELVDRVRDAFGGQSRQQGDDAPF